MGVDSDSRWERAVFVKNARSLLGMGSNARGRVWESPTGVSEVGDEW